MKVGYARVSTKDQSLDIQMEKLKAIGCDKIYSEKQSGKQANNRSQLQEMLDFVREGDQIVITRLDRISRSLKDLLDIVTLLETKGVTLTATEQVFDTSSSSGKLMFSLLGAFAAFELDIRKERQQEGITKALAEQRPYGRPVTTDHDKIKEALKAGGSVAEIVRDLKVSRTAVYNIRKSMIENEEI